MAQEAKTVSSQYGGPGPAPGPGAKFLHAARPSTRKKERGGGRKAENEKREERKKKKKETRKDTTGPVGLKEKEWKKKQALEAGKTRRT